MTPSPLTTTAASGMSPTNISTRSTDCDCIASSWSPTGHIYSRLRPRVMCDNANARPRLVNSSAAWLVESPRLWLCSCAWRLLGRVLVVLHRGVWTREEQCLVVSVFPLHHVWRSALFAAHRDDLAIARRLADVVTLDDNAISDCCVHLRTSWSRRCHRVRPSRASPGPKNPPSLVVVPFTVDRISARTASASVRAVAFARPAAMMNAI